MTQNRISFYNELDWWKTGRGADSALTLQSSRTAVREYRDRFRSNLQNVSVNPQADNSRYRVSNIQEIGRFHSSQNYSFCEAFIIRDIVDNWELMIIMPVGIHHQTTGVYNAEGISTCYILNNGTASWTTDYIFTNAYGAAATAGTWGRIDSVASYEGFQKVYLMNNDYASSTWGGSWEFPSIETAYTLDHIRSSDFGANIISGDPATSGPNPATAVGFGNWMPANFLTKNGYGYESEGIESQSFQNPAYNPFSYWVFEKTKKRMNMYTRNPAVPNNCRMTTFGKLFPSFANGGLANSSDTKDMGIMIVDTVLGNWSAALNPVVARIAGFRSDGSTRDATMTISYVGDRTDVNYKNVSDEIFTRKCLVANVNTTKGYLDPDLILEAGPSSRNVVTTAGSNRYTFWIVNKILNYPDADNPMVFTGNGYATVWDKGLGGWWGLTTPFLF